MIRLYTHFRSSASFRVRIALNLKDLAYEPVPVDFARGDHKQAGYLARNPQAFVPVLEHDGAVLTQSLAIIEYLDALWPTPPLLPASPLACARVRAFAELVACDTHPLNNLRVLRYLREQLALDEAAVTRWYRHWIAESFRAAEAMIAPDAIFCCGPDLGLADVCLVPQVYNARRFGCDLEPYPRLVSIADRLRELPAFARAAPEAQPDAV